MKELNRAVTLGLCCALYSRPELSASIYSLTVNIRQVTVAYADSLYAGVGSNKTFSLVEAVKSVCRDQGLLSDTITIPKMQQCNLKGCAVLEKLTQQPDDHAATLQH